MKIEFLKAYEDHTWDTEVIDVPDNIQIAKNEGSSSWNSAVMNWCAQNLYSQSKYRSVVLWAIYNTNAEDEDI